MKLRIMYIKQILFITFLILFNLQEVISQEASISIDKKPGMFIEFSLGSLQSHIFNEGTLSVAELLSGDKKSFFGSAEFGCFFSNYFGLSTGIGYTLYKTQLALDTYESNFSSKDSEDEFFELRVSASNIKEVQEIGLINVPISIIIRLPLFKTVGLFFQPGVNVAFPITKTYSSTGIFTYKGYYPSYNVLLENLPEYGLPSDERIESTDNLELKQFHFNLVLSAGFDFYLQDKFQVLIAAVYKKSLTNITEYDSNDNFQLTTTPDRINSMIGGWDNARIQSFGLRLSIRYHL